jgi:competence protein ComEA
MNIIALILRYKQLVAAGICIVVGIILFYWYFTYQPQQTSQDPTLTSQNALLDFDDLPLSDDSAAPPQPKQLTEPVIEYVVVYISGAVEYPDVYRLPSDARVKDVVLAAGGFTSEALSDQINLAARISDAEHIHIPSRLEHQGQLTTDIPGSSSTEQKVLLNINTASVADLQELPGIGPALAQRIVDHRAENGPFRSVGDLQNIRGIGPALFQEIETLVTTGL